MNVIHHQTYKLEFVLPSPEYKRRPNIRFNTREKSKIHWIVDFCFKVDSKPYFSVLFYL
jgi:hypothetical protein